MKRAKRSEGFTPLELEVMQALWTGGPGTVQEVHRRVAAGRSLAYNTVQTVLGILHRKGKVGRSCEQRAYVYSPLVSREQAGERAVKTLVERLFGGSPEELILSMVKSRQVTPEQLARIERLLEGEPDDHG